MNKEIGRELLKKELEGRKARNPRYTMRAFARALEISPSFLSKMLKGQAAVSDELLQRVLPKLRLTPEDRAALPKDLLPDTDRWDPCGPLSFYAGIIFSAARYSGPMNQEQLEELGIPNRELKQAIDRLVEYEIAVVEGGKLRVVVSNLSSTFGDRFDMRAFIQHAHDKWLDCYERAPEQVYYGSTMVPLSKETFDIAEKETDWFFSRVGSIDKGIAGPRKVYNITTSIFPVTKDLDNLQNWPD